jgi:hypothetical protein
MYTIIFKNLLESAHNSREKEKALLLLEIFNRVDRFRFGSVFNRLFPKPKPIFTKTETESVSV